MKIFKKWTWRIAMILYLLLKKIKNTNINFSNFKKKNVYSESESPPAASANINSASAPSRFATLSSWILSCSLPKKYYLEIKNYIQILNNIQKKKSNNIYLAVSKIYFGIHRNIFGHISCSCPLGHHFWTVLITNKNYTKVNLG